MIFFIDPVIWDCINISDFGQTWNSSYAITPCPPALPMRNCSANCTARRPHNHLQFPVRLNANVTAPPACRQSWRESGVSLSVMIDINLSGKYTGERIPLFSCSLCRFSASFSLALRQHPHEMGKILFSLSKASGITIPWLSNARIMSYVLMRNAASLSSYHIPATRNYIRLQTFLNVRKN